MQTSQRLTIRSAAKNTLSKKLHKVRFYNSYCAWFCRWLVLLLPHFPHLHHQYNSVEGDHGQDGVLKRGWHHKMPNSVLEGVPVLGHVARKGFGTDGEVYARSLKYKITVDKY